MTRSIGRRKLLSGAALGLGATGLGPLFGTLVRDAFGATPPKRFVVVGYGNGMLVDHYRPPGVRSETDWDLPAMFESLAPWKSKMLLLDQFWNPHNKDLHGNSWATLSVRPSARDGEPDTVGGVYSRPSGISLDRYVAKAIAGNTPLSSLNIALNDWKGPPHVSSDAANTPYPPHINPVSAWKATFGKGLGGGGMSAEASAAIAGDRSVLDFTRAETARFATRLPKAEKHKLDLMETSLRELEQSLAKQQEATASTCTPPGAPNAALDREYSQGNGTYVMPFGVQIDRTMVEADADLIANALVCGVTRVATLSLLCNSESHRGWQFLGGVAESSRHESQHKDQLGDVLKGDKFVVSMMARIWKKLAETPEGGGTVADNTLMMLINSGGGRHHDGHEEHGIALLGTAGGALRTGRYLRFPKGARCISDLYVGIANALGVPTTTFGTPEHCKGELPGLR